jgi:hypothetical protein
MATLQVTKEQIITLIDQLPSIERQEILEYLTKNNHFYSQSSQHPINQFAGKVNAFRGVNAVAWQQKVRSEWDEA